MVDPLPPSDWFVPRPGPVVLCILDGVGLGGGEEDDAVSTASTPVLDRLMADHPWRRLRAHGPWAGLPSEGDMGNSEVGHNAMGAGRVFDQGAKLVDAAIESGSAFASPVWKQLIAGKTLHLLGLVSDGNVHSHVDHVVALIEGAAADGVDRLRLHVLTDGRDVEARSALRWVEPLEARLAGHRDAGRDYRIASGGGRMHLTMDRYESEWAMVERGWRCHVEGEGRPFASASEAIRTLYAEDPDVDDQYLPAFVITDGSPVGKVEDGDSVLFFNFRGDRALEITRAFEGGPVPFERRTQPRVSYAGMMQYDGDLLLPKQYLVAPPDIDRTAGEYLAASGRSTYAISETHKFGHVTYFFNGNRSGKFDDALETYVQIPSRPGTVEDHPEMEAAAISTAVCEAVRTGGYSHVRLNYANGDMVGHTGNLEATRRAMEAVDAVVGELEAAVREADGILLVTADHGNADEMYMRKKGQILRDDSGRPVPKTSHTLAEVPFILVDPRGELTLSDPDARRGLASIATTILELTGLKPPTDYEPGLVGGAR